MSGIMAPPRKKAMRLPGVTLRQRTPTRAAGSGSCRRSAA